MSEIIQFPVPDREKKSDFDAFIDNELKGLPKKAQESIRFELIKTIDSYDAFFSEWSLVIPEEGNETLRKQIYDIAHEEHDRKLRMLKDIIKLKVQVLVAEYYQR